MIWCRFEREGKVSHGRIVDDEVIEVDGSPINSPSDTGVTYALGEVRLLAPIIPPMLYAAGPNHNGHVEGMAARRGSAPNYPKDPRTQLPLRPLPHRHRRERRYSCRQRRRGAA